MIIFQNRFMDREEAKVDMEDRGYQFGDGVYEVFRIYDGALFDFDNHLDRLVSSAQKIRIELPLSLNEIKKMLMGLVKENSLVNGTLYVQVTRGVANRTHHFPEHPKALLTAYTKQSERPFETTNKGIQTILMDDIRWLRCDIKSINLLPNVLAKQTAKEQGCKEAIFHRDGIVTEGSSSNVFIINGNDLQTHPANNLILNGITRRNIIGLASGLGLNVKEKPYGVEDLLASDEVFVTSTTLEVSPVIGIDSTVIADGQPGPVTRKLQERFEGRVLG
ncbi:D-amino-acid transaminase [Virgibacillus phasianinus]|uniref:D-alanine aminotransferase n=1 Tax=Virgibacillus phasianinus TaxID=2017483 RepID=A0A220U241_9BACI|nr:D-amino-acid transaminase [Virgibacillus phasianinus]ASK62334.1 D-amino-acid transaminase [Virgibacillus phasianinus]